MWSNEQMTPESSVSQYNLPCEQMFETSLTGNRIQSDGRHWRGVVVPSPPARIGNLHLVTENVPDHAGLHPFAERLHHSHGVQSIQPLVPSQAAPIDTAEDLLQELPELPFTHKDHLRFNFLPAPGPRRTTPETWNGARTLRTGRHTHIGQSSSQPESVQSRNTAGSILHGRPAASRLELSVNNPGVHSWVDSR